MLDSPENTTANRLRGDVVSWAAAWGAGLVELRDTAARLPGVPWWLWGVGLLGLLLWQGGRIVAFRRWQRSTLPAASPTRRAVRVIARRIGLARVPDVRMIDARVSPMVWGGMRPVLILPVGLWSQLDRPARKAILCHELAHLKRRDHWVRALELVVAALFWWHPVVWWARRRVHEEAELCCDAWVTWLLPHGRRAYAEALLQTRTYVAGRAGNGALAMGISTTGARRFARRLTMVMTSQNRPSATLAGYVLLVTVCVLGWAVTPARACPPDEQTEAAPKARARVEREQRETVERRRRALQRETQLREKRRAAAPAGAKVAEETYRRYLEGAEEGDRGDELDALRREVRELREMIHELRRDVRGGSPAPEGPFRGDRPRVFREREQAERLFAPRSMSAGGGEISHVYRLPDGKLDALTNLLKRDDVPLRIRPREDGIEVLGTPMQHRAFRAFVEMIESGWSEKEYELPQGKARDLNALMRRSDVPLLIRPQRDGLELRATDPQHRKFQAFLELIHPTGRNLSGLLSAGEGEVSGAPALQPGTEREMMLMAAIQEMRARHRQLLNTSEQLEARSEALEEQEERWEAQLEALQSQLESAEQQNDMHRLSTVMTELSERMNAVTSEAAAVAADAEAHEREAEAVEERLEALQSELEALRAAAPEVTQFMTTAGIFLPTPPPAPKMKPPQAPGEPMAPVLPAPPRPDSPQPPSPPDTPVAPDLP